MISPAHPLPEPGSRRNFASRRIWGICLRHIYLHTGSWPRVIEMLYWPVVNMLVWGFVGLYLTQRMTGTSSVSEALIAAVLLMEIFSRMGMNIPVLFLEELYSRNLGHLFASPIRFRDYIFGLVATSLVRSCIAIIPAYILAYYLFHFSIFQFGMTGAAYAGLLALNGCWYGILIMAPLLRFGLGAEWFGWMATQLLNPLIAPYYPVAVLPYGFKVFALCLPATYVFEDMRSVLGGHGSHAGGLITAFVLNLFYITLAILVVNLAYRSARRRGGLLQVGE